MDTMEGKRSRRPELQAPDEGTVTELSKIPWCAELLGDQNLTAYISPSRQVKPDGADKLFNSTLNTKSTIAEYVALYQQPQSQDKPIMELKAILTLGSDVNGFPNVCHGGIVATLLDEVMGELINVNLKHRTVKRTSYMTGYLNTSYKGKVTTPGTYLVVARMSKVDGRKLFISATVENGQGKVLAKGEALFIGLREPIGRL
jgi:acyl-coenzyme A thioesterase PaaI-like protein